MGIIFVIFAGGFRRFGGFGGYGGTIFILMYTAS